MKTLILACCISALTATAQNNAKPAGDPGQGKKVFERCSACHFPYGTSVKVGPGLQGLFKRTKLENGNRCNETSVREIIEHGGKTMPAFAGLSKTDKDDLMAYLKTL